MIGGMPQGLLLGPQLFTNYAIDLDERTKCTITIFMMWLAPSSIPIAVQISINSYVNCPCTKAIHSLSSINPKMLIKNYPLIKYANVTGRMELWVGTEMQRATLEYMGRLSDRPRYGE